MNRFRAMTAGVLVAGLLATGAVSAQGPRGGGPGGPGRPGGPGGRGVGGPGAPGGGLPLRALNLTDAQEQQVRSIREQERDTMRQLDARIREAGRAQRTAIETLPVNEALIRQTTAAFAEVQADVAVIQAHVQSQIWAVLTPAQQAQATKLRAEREAREQEQRQAAAERRQNRQQ